MRTLKILASILISAGIMSMSSCSIFKKNTNKVNAEEKESTMPSLSDIRGNGPGGKASTQPVDVSGIKLDKLSVERLNGMWTLRSINGVTLSAENGDAEDRRPYINFEASTGKFYAQDGCNTINGNYVADADNKLKIDCVLSTMMLCPDAKYEQQFKQGIINAASYKKEVVNNENILSLYNSKGSLIMTLVRPVTEFLEGAWKVVSIDGNKVVGADVTIAIDLAEEHVHGNAGCNIYNGRIFSDPDKDGSIQFHEIGVTRMLCPYIDTETAFLVALESVAYARQEGAEAQLLDANNKVVLTLEPIKVQ